MDRQQKKAKRFPPVVSAANVRLLVGDDMVQILTVDIIGKVDPWSDNAQYKGRADIFTLVNIFPENDSLADPAPQMPIADGGIHKESSDTDHPDKSKNRDPNLEWIDTVTHSGREGTADDRIDDAVDGRHACLDGRHPIRHDGRVDCFCAGDQAQSALDGDGADQAHGNNAP